VDPILQLNSTKTEIVDSFKSKEYLSKILKIGELKMKKIIKNDVKYNDYYYVEYSKCPKELVAKYNKPINRSTRSYAKKIKQINPNTRETTIFNSLNEILLKFGYANNTTKNAIANKTLLGGCMWEYYEKEESDKDNKPKKITKK
jgi:hypothetical protein